MIPQALALKVMAAFDKSINRALNTKTKQKMSFRVRKLSYCNFSVCAVVIFSMHWMRRFHAEMRTFIGCLDLSIFFVPFKIVSQPCFLFLLSGSLTFSYVLSLSRPLAPLFFLSLSIFLFSSSISLSLFSISLYLYLGRSLVFTSFFLTYPAL